MDIAEVLAKEYYNDDTIEMINEIRQLLAVPGIRFYGTPDGDIILVYMLISDKAVEMLEAKKSVDEFTPEFTTELLENPGDNIYIFRLVVHKRISWRKTLEYLCKKHHAKAVMWNDDKQVLLHVWRKS